MVHQVVVAARPVVARCAQLREVEGEAEEEKVAAAGEIPLHTRAETPEFPEAPVNGKGDALETVLLNRVPHLGANHQRAERGGYGRTVFEHVEKAAGEQPVLADRAAVVMEQGFAVSGLDIQPPVPCNEA